MMSIVDIIWRRAPPRRIRIATIRSWGTTLEFSLVVSARVANGLTGEEERQERIPDDRSDEFVSPMAMADVIGVPPAGTSLSPVVKLSRRGEFEPVSADGDHCLRAVPIGDYRLLRAAFGQGSPPADDVAWIRKRHGDLIARLVRTTTPRWYDNWTAAAPSPKRPPPIFPGRG